jgi:hypothetical protein
MGRFSFSREAFFIMVTCSECAAPDMACETRFNEFLVLEFTETGYGTVHHLTIATYMLQHSSKLTRQGWSLTRKLLREFLVENKSPDTIRKQNKNFIDSGKRIFNITSIDGSRGIRKIIWTKTILDVHSDNAEIYCREIINWANSALKDTEGLEA